MALNLFSYTLGCHRAALKAYSIGMKWNTMLNFYKQHKCPWQKEKFSKASPIGKMLAAKYKPLRHHSYKQKGEGDL